jgi:hypothetical protein
VVNQTTSRFIRPTKVPRIATRAPSVVPFPMLLYRCCYGVSHTSGASSTTRQQLCTTGLHLKNVSASLGILTSSQQQIRRRYISLRSYHNQAATPALPFQSKSNFAFVMVPCRHHPSQLLQQIKPRQSQMFFSMKAKTPRSNNHWRSPILRNPVVPPGSKRPPKIFKRLHNLRGTKNSDDVDDDDAIFDDGRLYRADRVLANRTGKSRKDCFQLIKERRVFILTDQIYNEIEAPSTSSEPLKEKSSIPLLLKQNGSNTERGTKEDTVSHMEESKKNLIQQYRLKVITGPSIKIGMHTKLRIDKYQDVPLPPPLLMVYHKPKVTRCVIYFAMNIYIKDLLLRNMSLDHIFSGYYPYVVTR